MIMNTCTYIIIVPVSYMYVYRILYYISCYHSCFSMTGQQTTKLLRSYASVRHHEWGVTELHLTDAWAYLLGNFLKIYIPRYRFQCILNYHLSVTQSCNIFVLNSIFTCPDIDSGAFEQSCDIISKLIYVCKIVMDYRAIL